MKLASRDAAGFFGKPPADLPGVLIYGPDTMRIAVRRQDLIAALIGPQGEEEMRLARIPAAELRKDPAQLLDAIKAQGFFPGPRVAFVEDAGDGLADVVKAALEDWRPGDATIVVTAGSLTAKSLLRKLFEGHPKAVAAALYADPPSRAEIEAELIRAGLPAPGRDAMDMLTGLGRDLDPGDFRQLLEKLSLYKLNDADPLSVADVEALAPNSIEAGVDDLVAVVAEGRAAEIGPLMRRLQSQGVQAVTLLILLTRHFRQLHAAAADPGGPDAGVNRLRPPVYGPRRDRLVRQARGWGVIRLEQALSLLTDTDLELRSAGQTAPVMSLTERMLIRLAMLGQR